MTTAKLPRKRKVQAKRLDGFSFDLYGIDPAVTPDFAYIPMLPASGTKTRDGRGPFTYNIETVKANMRANGADVPVFLDHNRGAAYGWVNRNGEPRQMPDGTWEWPVVYTEDGLEYVQSKAYRYTSPGFLYIPIGKTVSGEITDIEEISVTNAPAMHMRALTAAREGGYTVDIQTETDDNVTPEQLAMLGLTEGATTEEITAAIQALKTSCADAECKVQDITTAACATVGSDATTIVEAAVASRVTSGALVTKQAYDEVLSRVDAATASAKAATDALAGYHAAQAEATAVAAVDAAIVAGKYTPAAREACCKQARADLTLFNEITAALPVHPALAANAALNAPVNTGTTVTVDKAAEYAARVLGVSATTFEAGKTL